MAKRIEIDRAKPPSEEPGKGHNRWHPDIPAALQVEPMEELTIETRDSSDGQIWPGIVAADLVKMNPVAVDLRVGNVVDMPNVVVSAILAEDIFHR
jgi:acetamidase/formamidase